MKSFAVEIGSVLQAIDVDADNNLRWFGRPILQFVRQFTQPMGPSQRLLLLSLGLQDHLYHHFYCSGKPVPYAANWDTAPAVAHYGPFWSILSKANRGNGYWDQGWSLEGCSPTALELKKGYLKVVARTADCRFPEYRNPGRDEHVSLRHQKESFYRSPGYYLAFGDEPLAADLGQELIRIYWNVDTVGAEHLIAAVTSRLNSTRTPFQVKVLDDTRKYGRCDSAVLYLSKQDYAAFRATHAEDIFAALEGHWTDAIPAFTKRVAPGVGIAEDPVGSASFGQHRSGLIAKAIVMDIGQDFTLGKAIEVVASHFRLSGIDPDRPYLSSSSHDDYEVFPQSAATSSPAPIVPQQTASPLAEAELVDVALDIGQGLASSAVWHRGRCNWIGSLGLMSGAWRDIQFGSIGTDLYDGTSGIALFLGELFGVTKDQQFRRTALGAIRNALADPANALTARPGFYIGSLGKAVVAARLGLILDCPRLIERSRVLCRLTMGLDIGFDLMSGCASCIVGYLALHELLGDPDLLDRAIAMGDLLLTRAERFPDGASWSSDRQRSTMNLTGFSHGTAGAAYALLGLFAATGKHEFRRTAEAALQYERSWFNNDERNWPDFRQVTRDVNAQTSCLPCATTWCHGAPGIAISRMRAAELLPDLAYRAEACIALATTAKHLSGWLDTARVNYSVCHGVAGNAEVLLMGLRSDTHPDDDLGTLIERAAQFGSVAYGLRGDSWPCGVGLGGENPSLMLGLAGIGYFYLRMANENIPSVIAPLSRPGWTSGR